MDKAQKRKIDRFLEDYGWSKIHPRIKKLKKNKWIFGNMGRNKLDILIRQIVKDEKRKYLQKLYKLKLINLPLSNRQNQIIKMRFIDLKSLEEVGQKFGVSKERIRQLEGKSLSQIKVLDKDILI